MESHSNHADRLLFLVRLLSTCLTHRTAGTLKKLDIAIHQDWLTMDRPRRRT